MKKEETKENEEKEEKTVEIKFSEIEDLKQFALEIPTKYGINILNWISSNIKSNKQWPL